MAENGVDFTATWRYGDIVFIVEDRQIYANKYTLCMSSPVMEAMFNADFSEKNATEIPLPGKIFNDFVELMKVTHPPNKDIDNSNVYQLLALAHEYQMEHVSRRCEKLLLSTPPSVKHLVLADKYSMSDLQHYCIQFVHNTNLHTLKEMEDFDHIELETLVAILTHKVEEFELKFTQPTPEPVPVPEPSKQVICKLMSSPPSVDNLVLADLYSLPELHQTCVKYAKGTTLAKLRSQKAFTKICPETLMEVLTLKVEELEPKVVNLENCKVNLENCKQKIYDLVLYKGISRNYWCSESKQTHYVGEGKDCYKCNIDIISRIEAHSASTH